MKTMEYQQLKEKLYFEKMSSGLEVFVLPRKEGMKTYATFTTKYGSIDNRFVPLGQEKEVHVPDGIAHFLEHKLFEKEDGDVFQQFSRQGASANAFTSFNRTAYLFSCTSNVTENLLTLLDFVQEPYFAEKTVEKEKGIIGQEIRMYDDNPDWRAYFGVIDNMYANHPVKIDIAGTIESISEINKDLLYQCYETFYHPSNMVLFIVGPVDPTEILSLVRENQVKKEYEDQPPIERFFENEPEQVDKKEEIIKMPVQTPKCHVGIKTKKPNRAGSELLKRELSISIILDFLFGKSSKYYEELYNNGLIDDSFSYDYTEEQGFGFAIIGGDSQNPDELAQRIKEILFQFKDDTISVPELNRVRKKKLGSFLRSLNSPEFIANQFTRYRFNEMDLFEVIPELEKITDQDIKDISIDFIDEDCFTVCTVKA